MSKLSPVRVLGWGSLLAAAAFGAAVTLGSCAELPATSDGYPDAGERVGKIQQAATGVCDSNPPVSTQACIDAVQANGAVINDIFKDSNGLTGPQLPVFGTLFNNWPNCATSNVTGCNCGESLAPFDCPGQYSCASSQPPLFNNVAQCANALDRLWAHPCRLTDHNLINGCPNWASCTPDGVGGNYFPWEGMVFDLGGPSNQVVIFAQNDHGPQPCESLEYTVYLSDNPFSQQQITDPATNGVDPNEWNRAVLTTIFTKGWTEVRPPDPVGHAACGDTALYSVEEDSFVQVFSLPCGINFRYAAIIAGNDGLDFPECAFDSQEAELDAVAGLTESGAAVCPDADGDLFIDCNCPTAPPICDCDDLNPQINPGAPEPCDSPDVDCDGLPGGCLAPLVCHESICVPTCEDEGASCPTGASCTNTSQGFVCVPDDCSVGGCPQGSICVDDMCVPACDNVVCPGEQICQDGHCLDPCNGVQCPPPLVCQNAQCVAPCNCFGGDIGCVNLPGTICDKGGTDLCVDPDCAGVICPSGQHCDPTSGLCVDFCHPGVMCPLGQKCLNPEGCVPLCFGVTCEAGLECNPDTGLCEDTSCTDVTCLDGSVCVDGECVEVEGSGGAGGTAGSGSGGAGAAGTNDADVITEPQGCGCELPGRPHERRPYGWLALLGLMLSLRRYASTRRQSNS
jgi:MYXO-CTERM domain-containing protein